MLSILSFPSDENSSFIKGCSKAPTAIIKAFNSESSNMFSENGFNCGNDGQVRILDTLELQSGKTAIDQIKNAVKKEYYEFVNIVRTKFN